MHVAALESWRPTNLGLLFEHIQMFYIRMIFFSAQLARQLEKKEKEKANVKLQSRFCIDYYSYLQLVLGFCVDLAHPSSVGRGLNSSSLQAVPLTWQNISTKRDGCKLARKKPRVRLSKFDLSQTTASSSSLYTLGHTIAISIAK